MAPVDVSAMRSTREENAIERGLGAALGDCEELFRRLQELARQRGATMTVKALPQVSPHGTIGTGQGRAEGHEERTGKIVSDWKDLLLEDFFKLTGIRAKTCTEALRQLDKLESGEDKEGGAEQERALEHKERVQQQVKAQLITKSLGKKSKDEAREAREKAKADKAKKKAADKKAQYEASDKAKRDQKRKKK
jgi:colicin import membrane protein